MDPRLAVALLVVLAGCAGTGGSGAPDRNTATNIDAPPTRSTVTPEVPDDASEANTVAYAELSAEERRAFDAAATDGAEFLSSSIDSGYFDPSVSDPFENNEYVLKEGTYFELSYRSGALYSSNIIEAVEARPSGNATVVAFDELSNRSQEVVRPAIEAGTYSTAWSRSNSLPEDLSGVEYVRYSGTHYRLNVGVGDAWVQVWTAERVE